MRAPSLLILALAIAVPTAAIADTKAEKAAKKKKKAKKAKSDKEQEKADLEAAEAEAAAAAAEAENATPDAGADADALKTKADVDAEAETAKAEAEAPKPEETEKVAGEAPETVVESAYKSVTIGKGRLVIAGSTVNVNLSAGAVGKPVSLAPSVWYGISDNLSIGLTHDGGTTGMSPRPGIRVTTIEIGTVIDTEVSGVGICVTGTGDGNCPKPYDNVGADVLIGVASGKLGFAAHIGVDVLSIDQMTIGARLGGLGRFALASKIALVFDPRVQVGITDRDFNGDGLDVPIWVWFEPSPTLGFYLHTGIAGPFDGFADAFNVPVGVGASIRAGAKLTLGADFQFTNLLGKGSSADGRVLGVRLAVAL